MGAGGGGLAGRPLPELGALETDSPSSTQNIELWMKDKSEVEVVDLILKLRERLVRRCAALPALSQPAVQAACP